MDPTFCRSGLLILGSPFDAAGGHPEPAGTVRVRLPAREPKIGVVVFETHKGEQAEAILDIEGVWRCPKLPVLDRVLNALHGPKRPARADIPFGQAELIRVAAWLKGVAKVRCP